MKIPRFVKEYASYQKQQIFANKQMQSGIQYKMIAFCDRAVCLLESGCITLDECMRLLASDEICERAEAVMEEVQNLENERKYA